MTMANAPLWDGTAGDIEVIWVSGEAENFCKGDWTTQITLVPKENFLRARSVNPQSVAAARLDFGLHQETHAGPNPSRSPNGEFSPTKKPCMTVKNKVRTLQ
jgi:hypothetical protein